MSSQPLDLPGPRLCVRLCAIVAGLCLLTAPAIAAELRGVVIGIDKYPKLGERNQLFGAVNDAQDIAKAMKEAGASDVRLLTDGEATKAAIQSTWTSLVEISQPGDTLVFSYAGHGSQEPEPPGRGGEADGKNENFLLGGFAPNAPDNAERIVDDEMFEWLKLADDKGVRVVFIADSCHSGTMYRSASTPSVRFRNVTIPEITEDHLTLPPPAFANAKPDDFKEVTFIAATEESRVVPEIRIEGQERGALSYSFARAIEGGADRDKDGRITQEELVSFLVPSVHQLVESQQTPQVLPVRAGRAAIIESVKSAPEKQVSPDADSLPVAVIDGTSDVPAKVAGVKVVPDIAQSELFWNVSTGVVEHIVGGPVALDVNERSVVPVFGKWATIKWLQNHASGAPGKFILHSGNQTYKLGQEISLSFEGAELPYVTLFNLAPDGRVEFFVEPEEVNVDWRGRKADWTFRPDKPPFGAEHLIAVFTEQPLTDLHAALQGMKSADLAIPLRGTVERALGDRKFQFAMISIYTSGGK
ncbi:MAG: caspase family protein [Parvibaculaceae bacterium]